MSIGLMPTCSVQGNGSTARRPSRNAGGTRPRLGIRDIDYQLVIKSSVETQPKKCRRFHIVVKNTSDYQLVTILVRGLVPPVALYLLKRFARSLRDQFPHDEQIWDTHQRKEEEGAGWSKRRNIGKKPWCKLAY